MILKLALLVLAVSADGFAAAVGLGSAGIKIPFRSAVVINLTGTVFLGVSVFFADCIGSFIPVGACRVISSVLLAALGVINLFHGRLKQAAEKGADPPEQIKLYFDGTAADRDKSKTISCREALALSVALSADSLVTGISAGLGGTAFVPLMVMAFFTGISATAAGAFIGRHIISTRKVNLQLICGIILIALAFFK